MTLPGPNPIEIRGPRSGRRRDGEHVDETIEGCCQDMFI